MKRFEFSFKGLVGMQKNKGFTLVELSIVLLIISIVTVGILQVKEMLENSKVKSVMKDLNGIAVAYYAYKDRVGSIPGDSDNNGKIDVINTFWQDLRREGYIVGAATDNTPVSHSLQGDILALSAAGFNGGNSVCATAILTKYARMIDFQMDDANPQSGNIRTSDLSAYSADDEALVTICRELSSVDSSIF